MSEPTKGLDEKFCHECGAIIRAKAEICPKCGVRQPTVYGNAGLPFFQSGIPSGRNRLVATLFAAFLGGLGIHKFYLGQAGLGVAYLILCWTFIPSVIGFIEGIGYLTMTDEAFNAKYNVQVEPTH
jgi:TM2 domain-containing membrane protein YozV